jgi:Uma2 family endonuclease
MAVALQYEHAASYAPMTLHLPGLTEEQFIEWGERFPDFRIEYTADGELLIMPGTSMETGDRNTEIVLQLGLWARKDGRGRVYDSSTSFLLPNGARRSPDASWVDSERKRAAQQPGLRFPPLVPDFIVELKSPTDGLKKVRDKMDEWMENGAQLGWLIDPEARSLTIYRAGRSPETVLHPHQAAGEGPIDGFVLDLSSVWAIV